MTDDEKKEIKATIRREQVEPIELALEVFCQSRVIELIANIYGRMNKELSEQGLTTEQITTILPPINFNHKA